MNGTTDRADVIRTAADWLHRQEATPSPVIPALRRNFDLTAKEAIEAIRLQQLEGARHGNS